MRSNPCDQEPTAIIYGHVATLVQRIAAQTAQEEHDGLCVSPFADGALSPGFDVRCHQQICRQRPPAHFTLRDRPLLEQLHSEIGLFDSTHCGVFTIQWARNTCCFTKSLCGCCLQPLHGLTGQVFKWLRWPAPVKQQVEIFTFYKSDALTRPNSVRGFGLFVSETPMFPIARNTANQHPGPAIQVAIVAYIGSMPPEITNEILPDGPRRTVSCNRNMLTDHTLQEVSVLGHVPYSTTAFNNASAASL
jgi:hypothetical protein